MKLLVLLVMTVGCAGGSLRDADGCWTDQCRRIKAAEWARESSARMEREERLRTIAAIQNARPRPESAEDRAYRECRAFVLNVEAAAADPAKAQACMNVIALVDGQQEAADRRQAAERAQWEAENARLAVEAQQRAAAEQAERQRRAEFIRAMGNALTPPTPPPSPPPPAPSVTRTDCQRYGSSVNCTSRTTRY